MPEANVQVCPVCTVKIVKSIGGDQVLFSSGPPGTRAKLTARVCQFVTKEGCINKNPALVGEIRPDDYYKPQL
ncbi:MAG: hypothetical protein HC825_03410 [Oscillatoriales cyanobacterium RM1_1_9]|nr:hypothetical protein [Oscillatoriales cyanobacterium RM2_1_1]NJO70999.1 hypothetical protein [Oscillatoriales cyanobacterium RM1_1_9]